MQVPFSKSDQQHVEMLPELLAASEAVFRSGQFTLGEPVERFEQQFADYHGRRFAVGVNSGTDALWLSLRALNIGPGDEVITSSNTFITSVSSIAMVGATPVLVDIGDDDNLDVNVIEQAITPKTKAIMPVHWMGRPCNMDKIVALAEKHNLHIIEDCAQAIAARFNGKLVGTFGIAGCYSLHPYKTLNACGDAGIIITDDQDFYERLRMIRQNGLSPTGVCHRWSNNSRLDPLQAAILQVKFKRLKQWTERRIQIAEYYHQQLKEVAEITLPTIHDDRYAAVYHTFIVKAQKRDALRQYLDSKGIVTRIHYGTPIHQQPAAQGCVRTVPNGLPRLEAVSTQVLSLPIYPELSLEELDYVVKHVHEFYCSIKEKV